MDPNSSIKTNDATAAAGWAPTYPNYEVLPPKVACLIPQCLEKFTTETELEDHKRKKGHWWCQECRVNLWDQKLLFEHNGRAHGQSQELVCPGCGSEYSRAGALVKHIEAGLCSRLSCDMLHERRLRQIEFNIGLRQLNPANDPVEPVAPDPAGQMERTLARDHTSSGNQRPPHLLPDLRIRNYIDSSIRPDLKLDLKNNRDGYARVANLHLGDNRAPNDAFSPVTTEQNSNKWQAAPESTVDTGSVMLTMSDLQIYEAPTLPAGNKNPNEKIVDPDAPGFNAAVFYHSMLEHFKCPYKRCKSKMKSATSFTTHLRRAHRNNGPEVEYKCPRCAHYFSSMEGAVQHAETATRRCNVRMTDAFREFIGHITGGLLDGLNGIDDCLPDGNPRFIISRAFLESLPWRPHPLCLKMAQRNDQEGVGRGRMKEWAGDETPEELELLTKEEMEQQQRQESIHESVGW